MKAATYVQYGSPDVVTVTEVPRPMPQDHDVLIRVHATTVTTGDWRARSLQLPKGFGFLGRLVFGFSKPRQPILGTELAGEIVAVGKGVSRFTVGDRVFAFTGAGMGCHAEYKCMPEDGMLSLMPANFSYEEAAAIGFGGTTALRFLRQAKIKGGDRVLINGASGGVGTAAVQLAKHFGADVTGVCSTGNVTLVTSIGADRVIDYTREDVTQNGETYDIIIDTVGTLPFARSKGSLAKGGRLLLVFGTMNDLLLIPWVSMTSTHKVIGGPARLRPEDLTFLARLAESGEFKPVIGRRYPFEQIAEAHRYVDTGHKQGNVVISLHTHPLPGFTF
ncbi:MAG: NAD(P)-dependent alcohol dehydrogenase [Candidatus Sericytochromatia bacterium]|nr:NAD(P)-dependent alcohol dehydrogenase [Candidatus Sericytochromatia bacterium]